MADSQSLAEKFGLAPRKVNQGSIVLYNGGHYRVTRLTKRTVNLGHIFAKGIVHKGVPLSEVQEDREAWYQAWTQSESYRCM